MGDDAVLETLQRQTFLYFLEEADPETGLVQDTTRPESVASIAATGLGLACYPVAAERGFIARADAVARTLRTLRFLWHAEQSEAPDATGHRGFFYHFLDPATGRRVWECELSSIDSTFLFAGALAAATYFDGDGEAEREVRSLADAIYRRADWTWMLNPESGGAGEAVSHGWRPERGFLPYRWVGYNEALLLYALGLGSPTHPLPPSSYAAWTAGYRWKTLYGHEHLFAGPLFTHQLSHVWVDFRDIQDAFMRERGIDYFENSRRATLVQRAYARRNTRGFDGYGEDCWGVTASDGPGPAEREVGGETRTFYGYRARGVPWGLDDGTLSPWAVAASLPFAPDEVFRALHHVNRTYPDAIGRYGYLCSINPTFPDGDAGGGWISSGHYGIDQGPVVLMIENYRSGLLWRLMRGCRPLADGLRRAGFTGGWLGDAAG
ncbi:MAG: glucoamylase family protein [Rhodothermales bacterium]